MDDNEFFDGEGGATHPTLDLTGGTAPEAPEATPEAPPEPPEESATADDLFDARHREGLDGMLFLGRTRRTYRRFGHTFRLHTLDSGEILQVAEAHKPYRGTIAEERAYQVLALCLAIETVDGEHLPTRLDDIGEPDLVARFEQVKRWHPPVLDKLFNDYLILESEVREVLDAMGKQ